VAARDCIRFVEESSADFAGCKRSKAVEVGFEGLHELEMNHQM
jgi:hypothetical protein